MSPLWIARSRNCAHAGGVTRSNSAFRSCDRYEIGDKHSGPGALLGVMRLSVVAALLASAGLVGCVATRPATDWVRLDGSPADPAAVERAYAECVDATAAELEPHWDETPPNSEPTSGQVMVDSLETLSKVRAYREAIRACMNDLGYEPR